MGRRHVIRNRIATVILLLVLGGPLLAQQQKIDSLKEALRNACQMDSFKIHDALTSTYGLDNYQSTIYHCRKAYQLSWKTRDSLAIVKSGRRFCQLRGKFNRLDSQLIIGEKILPIARRNKFIDEAGRISKILGEYFIYKSKYDIALQYLYESLAIREQLLDKEQISSVLLDIGLLYYKLYDDDKALKYYHRSLKLKNEISETWGLETLLLNMSLCYSSKHDFENSRKFINQVKGLCHLKDCSPSTKLELEVAEGLHFLRSDSLAKAELCFMRGQPLALEEQNTRLGLDCTLNLSKIYLKQGKIDLATLYLKEAEKSENIAGFNIELLQLYTQLSEVYREVNNYRMMAYYQNQYIHLKDSISGDDVRNNLMRVQADYLERENEARIKSQAELLTLQDEVIDRQLIVRKLVVVVVILLMLLAYVLFLLNRNKRMINALLDRKVEEQTRVLETSYRELKVTAEKRDAALRKAAREILSSMITVKGLCSTGLKDVNQSSTIQTLTDIGNASDRIRDSANTILE